MTGGSIRDRQLLDNIMRSHRSTSLTSRNEEIGINTGIFLNHPGISPQNQRVKKKDGENSHPVQVESCAWHGTV
jgi:hypothetical protein